MAIKLVAVDMDDTLLNKENIVSPHTAEVVRRAVAQGVAVTVATGRMFSSARKFANQMGLDVPLITYNGALVRASLSGEILYHRPIEQELAAEVLAMFRKNNWYIQAYVDDTLYIKEETEQSEYYYRVTGSRATAIGDKLFTMPMTPSKLLALEQPEKILAISPQVRAAFGSRLGVAISKPRFLEMIDPSVSKGRALAFLAEKLGLTRDEVMAVGDSENDLDMIRYAGLGVAMGNASDKVKAEAQAVTVDNASDGVAAAIERYVLAK